MLLILSARALRPLLSAPRGKAMPLRDLPAFTRDSLGLHGLALTTDLLKGVSRDGLEELRERGDKAACACLLLSDPDPLALSDADPAKAERAVDRTRRILRAAQLLGCNAAAVGIAGLDEPRAFERTVDRLREVMAVAEKLHLNLLIAPGAGLTRSADRIAALIKKAGGFRIGTYPEFAMAAEDDDPGNYLRRLTPYASVVRVSSQGFTDPKGGDAGDDLAAPVVHAGFDLAPLVEAIRSVGYDATLAINYEGSGDPTLGVLRTKAMLEAILDAEGASKA